MLKGRCNQTFRKLSSVLLACVAFTCDVTLKVCHDEDMRLTTTLSCPSHETRRFEPQSGLWSHKLPRGNLASIFAYANSKYKLCKASMKDSYLWWCVTFYLLVTACDSVSSGPGSEVARSCVCACAVEPGYLRTGGSLQTGETGGTLRQTHVECCDIVNCDKKWGKCAK